MKAKLTRYFVPAPPAAAWSPGVIKAALAKFAFKEIEDTPEASSAVFFDKLDSIAKAAAYFDELFGRFLAEKYEQAKWAQGQDLKQVFEGDIARAYSIMQAHEDEGLTAGLSVVEAIPDWATTEDEAEAIPMAELPATEEEPEAELVH